MYRPLAGDLKESTYTFSSYTIKAPPGVHIDDLKLASFWSRVQGLKAGDTVTVLSQDNALDVELRVVAMSETGPKMRMLRAYADKVAMAKILERRSAKEVEEANKDPFFIKWLGPSAKYAVLRTDTLAPITRDLPTREDAEAELERLMEAHSEAVVA